MNSNKGTVTDFNGIAYKDEREMCFCYGIPPQVYQRRMSLGYSQELALKEPVKLAERMACGLGKLEPEFIGPDGVAYKDERDMCAQHNITVDQYKRRLGANWDPIDALTIPIGQTNSSIPSHKKKYDDGKGHVFSTVRELSEFYSLPKYVVDARLRAGESVPEAVGRPVVGTGVPHYDHFGQYFYSFAQMCDAWGKPDYVVRLRLKHGKSLKDALETPYKARAGFDQSSSSNGGASLKEWRDQRFYETAVECAKYVAEHGGLPSRGCPDKRLYQWLNYVRDQHRHQELKLEREQVIREVCPEILETSLMDREAQRLHDNRLARIKEAAEWWDRNRRVPRTRCEDPEETRMYQWYSMQRKQYKYNQLKPEIYEQIKIQAPWVLQGLSEEIDAILAEQARVRRDVEERRRQRQASQEAERERLARAAAEYERQERERQAQRLGIARIDSLHNIPTDKSELALEADRLSKAAQLPFGYGLSPKSLEDLWNSANSMDEVYNILRKLKKAGILSKEGKASEGLKPMLSLLRLPMSRSIIAMHSPKFTYSIISCVDSTADVLGVLMLHYTSIAPGGLTELCVGNTVRPEQLTARLKSYVLNCLSDYEKVAFMLGVTNSSQEEIASSIIGMNFRKLWDGVMIKMADADVRNYILRNKGKNKRLLPNMDQSTVAQINLRTTAIMREAKKAKR